jgi:hypothetical protein
MPVDPAPATEEHQMIDRSRRRLAATFAVLGLLLASLGGAGGLATATAAKSHAAKKHHTTKKAKKKSCIPQGAKHTDNDPDNHGGPNDGDGCV